jgi:hypothetical protein
MLDAQTKGIDTSKAGCQEKKSENNEVEGVRQNNSETSRNVKENEGCTPDRKKHQEQSILDCWIEDSVKQESQLESSMFAWGFSSEVDSQREALHRDWFRA